MTPTDRMEEAARRVVSRAARTGAPGMAQDRRAWERPVAAILEAKRAEIARLEASTVLTRDQRTRARFSFHDALRRPGVAIIAEIKRASPSAGAFGIEPVALRNAYLEAKVDAFSILTDSHFGMAPSDLRSLAEIINAPVLRKDFILAESQIVESDLLGADAILLIAAFLSNEELDRFGTVAEERGLDVLYEVRSIEEIARVPKHARIIGVNNRNLEDPRYATDTKTAAALRRSIPPGRITVAESGISRREDIPADYDAVLIGGGLIREFQKMGRVTDLISALRR